MLAGHWAVRRSHMLPLISFIDIDDPAARLRIVADVAAAAAFFALPLDERLRIPVDRHNRGYGRVRK